VAANTSTKWKKKMHQKNKRTIHKKITQIKEKEKKLQQTILKYSLTKTIQPMQNKKLGIKSRV
jgi:hypothetical protein